jgi:hypothetical protein
MNQFQEPQQFDYYRVASGENIDSIAFNYYGDVDKAYVIAAVNQIIDPIYDWYMSDEMLLEYCFQKYTPKKYYTPPRKIQQLQMEWYKSGVRLMPELLDNKLGVMLCAINQIHHYINQDGDIIPKKHCVGNKLITAEHPEGVESEDCSCTASRLEYSRYDGTIVYVGSKDYSGVGRVSYTDTSCRLIPITNYDHERALNQEKQIIRVLKKDYLGKFETNYNGLLYQLRQD